MRHRERGEGDLIDNGFREVLKVLNEQYEYFKTFGEQFASLLKPIKELGEQLASSWKPIKELGEQFASLLKPSKELGEQFASLLKPSKELGERYDFWIKHNWHYFIELLPRSLIDETYARKDSIQTIEVDKIVIDFFRKDNCKKLKEIVKGWSNPLCFSQREWVFHEALVNHSRRYFNASTTLLTIHTEGVITEFVNSEIEPRKLKVKKAIESLKNHLGNSELDENRPKNSQDACILSYTVLDEILAQFKCPFDLDELHAAPNNTRHKIAHGHVVEKEIEVNSLKKFLHLHQIYLVVSTLTTTAQE